MLDMMSGGNLTPFERHKARHGVESAFWRRVTGHIPSTTECTATGCGFDVLSRSGKNVSCTECGGTGQITSWATAYFTCRVSWNYPAATSIWKGVVSGELGDVIIQTRIANKELMESFMEIDGAYIDIDDHRVKPRSVTLNQVEGFTSLDVRCDLVKGGA